MRQATWVNNGVSPQSLWTVTIFAPVDVSNVFVNINGQLQQIWEMVQVDNTNSYRLPDWRLQIGGIMANQSHVFGFIINNSNTESPVTLNRVECPGVPSVTPSAVPSASISASPLPSASVPASPSPSPSIVKTPQPSATPSPSACSAVVSQVPRNSSQGGSWTQDGLRYQIYDVTVANRGSLPLKNVRIILNIASDQQVPDNQVRTFPLGPVVVRPDPIPSSQYQFWNLVRVNSNTFDVAPMVLPGPGSSTSSIGYVLTTPVNSSSSGSSISSVVFSC